jgi:predicted TIM-barrel fold metal-dependent hydrolase
MRMDDLILVSIDDHVVEPGTLFDGRLPAKLADRAPRLVRDAAGHHKWIWEGTTIPNFALNAVAGRPREEYGNEPTAFEQMRRGTWDVRARIDDMNANGVLASMCFPSFPSFCGRLFLTAKDRELALAVLRAYNDWHCDEWCGSAPGRLIPLALLPAWDVDASVAELRRMARRGVRAFSMSEQPENSGLPSIHAEHWYPIWRTCCEENVVVAIHIGSGGGGANGMAVPSALAPVAAAMAVTPIQTASCAAELVFSRFLTEFRELRILLAECGIGWVPYFLERCDWTHARHKYWTRVDMGGRTPSEVFREQIVTSFFDDYSGIALRDRIGVDMIAWECDYPHSDTTWPTSPEAVWANLKGVPEADVRRLTHENALRLLDFDPFRVLPKAECSVGALRAKARSVDLSPITTGKGAPPVPDGSTGPVTIADVQRQLSAALDGR